LSLGADQYSNQPVPAEQQVGWLRVGLISAMVSFSLPTFLTGAEIFRAGQNDTVFSATWVGCALTTLIAAIAAIAGSIGARTHLSSYVLTRIAFGRRGAALVNLAFAISLLGWFGVNIDLFGGTLVALFADAGLGTLPIWAAELLAGVLMTVTTIYGFRGINALSTLLVPVMILVTALLLTEARAITSFADLLGAAEPRGLSFGDAVSSVVGGMVIGAVILPDITRYIRQWSGAIFVAVLSYLVVTGCVITVGGWAAEVFDRDDLLEILLVAGLSWGAFVIIVLGSWVLNSLNLYSSALSIEATVPATNYRLLTILLGVLGTLAAFLNILDYFLSFLFYLAIVFVPVAGVIAVDYLLVRRNAYHPDFATSEPSRPPAGGASALFAWALGAMIALLGAEGIFSLSGIAAVDALLIAALSYWLLATVQHRGQPPRRPGTDDVSR